MWIALALTLLLLGCAAPAPTVEDVSASEVEDSKTVVTVRIHNRGGEGSAVLRVTVRESGSGDVVGREERAIEVKPEERLTISVEVHLPEDVTDVQAEAEARYPPD